MHTLLVSGCKYYAYKLKLHSRGYIFMHGNIDLPLILCIRYECYLNMHLLFSVCAKNIRLC